MLEEARRRAVELRKIRPPVSGQIEKLHSPARDSMERGIHGDCFNRSEFGYGLSVAVFRNSRHRAEIAFVKPRARLFGQDARYSVAVQVYPLVIGPVQTCRQIFETLIVK